MRILLTLFVLCGMSGCAAVLPHVPTATPTPLRGVALSTQTVFGKDPVY